jgi:hypothetical protein
MLPDDVPIWQAFLNGDHPPYTLIDYDVPVGAGRHPGPDFTPNIVDMAIQLSRRRIDAVGHLPDVIHIIEVTHTAGLRAIGQLHTYPQLYRQTYHPTLPLVPVLVAGVLQSDVAEAVIASGCLLYLTGPHRTA